MRKITPTPRLALPWLAIGMLSAALAACGGAATATQTPPQSETPNGGSVPDNPAPSGSWTANLPVGGSEGRLAPATEVLLADGSRSTLGEIAGGKPMLLYFFATW